MAALTFNALEFESQVLPDALPVLPDDPFPVDCGLTPDQKSDLGKHSEFVGHMDTPDKVIAHWEQVAVYRAQREETLRKMQPKPKRDPAEKEALALAQQEHTNVVNQLRTEWREAVAARNKAVDDWNTFVKAKHDAFTTARDAKVVL